MGIELASRGSPRSASESSSHQPHEVLHLELLPPMPTSHSTSASRTARAPTRTLVHRSVLASSSTSSGASSRRAIVCKASRPATRGRMPSWRPASSRWSFGFRRGLERLGRRRPASRRLHSSRRSSISSKDGGLRARPRRRPPATSTSTTCLHRLWRLRHNWRLCRGRAAVGRRPTRHAGGRSRARSAAALGSCAATAS